MKKFLLTLGAMALFAVPSFAQETEVEVDYIPTDSYPNDVFPSTVNTVTKGEGNTFIVSNLYDSGQDIIFGYDPEAELDENGATPISYTAIDPTFVVNDEFNTDGSLRLRDYIMYQPGYASWTFGSYTMTSANFRDGSAWAYPDEEEGLCFVLMNVWENIGTWTNHWVQFYMDLDELSSVKEVSVDNSPVEYYNLQGVKVANPTNGLYIVRQGKKAHKVMINK